MSTRISAIAPAPPAGGAPTRARWLALAALCVSLLIVTLDTTGLNVSAAAYRDGLARHHQ